MSRRSGHRFADKDMRQRVNLVRFGVAGSAQSAEPAEGQHHAEQRRGDESPAEDKRKERLAGHVAVAHAAGRRARALDRRAGRAAEPPARCFVRHAVGRRGIARDALPCMVDEVLHSKRRLARPLATAQAAIAARARPGIRGHILLMIGRSPGLSIVGAIFRGIIVSLPQRIRGSIQWMRRNT
jgi:hypothetical protein